MIAATTFSLILSSIDASFAVWRQFRVQDATKPHP